MIITSPSCVYDQGSQEIHSHDKVHMQLDQGFIRGVGYDVFVGDSNIRIRKAVKGVLKSAK